MMAFVGKWMQELDCGERNAGMGLEGGGRERDGRRGTRAKRRETIGGGGGGWRDTNIWGEGGVGEGVQNTKRLERHLPSEPLTCI